MKVATLICHFIERQYVNEIPVHSMLDALHIKILTT